MDSLKFYRNYDTAKGDKLEEFKTEFDNMKNAVANHRKNAENVTWQDFYNRRAAKAFGNGFVLMLINVFSGASAMLYYTPSIFAATRTALDPNSNTLIMGVIQVGGVYAASILIDLFGRKPLMIFSSTATCLGMAIFGLFGFLLEHTSVDMSDISSWLPIVNVGFGMFVVNVGLMPLPFMLLVELMPPTGNLNFGLCATWVNRLQSGLKFAHDNFDRSRYYNNSTTAGWHEHIFLIAFTVTIITFAHGFGLGWFSVILAKLQSPTETALDFVITVSEGSWIGGLASLGGGSGNIIYGVLADLIGRKATIYLLAIPYMVSWVLIYFAKSVEYLYVGRFLAGITGGGTYVIIPIFIGEIAEPKIRGRLTSFFSLTLNCGIFIGYIVTARLPYHFIPVWGVVLPTIYLLSQLFFPETPMFLLQRGLDERAKKSLKFYRNFQPTTKEKTEEFEVEFDKLRAAVTASHNINKNVRWRDFCNKRAGIAYANSLALMWLNIFCSAYAILYYTSSIFIQARADLDPDTNTIIVGLVQVVGVCMATILVDRFGRKPLLIFSCGATCVGLTIFGLYGYLLQHTSVDLSAFSSWFPLVNVCLIMFVVNSGLIPIPFVLLVELMPSKIRAKATAICLVIFNIFGFLLMKLFPISLEEFGLSVPMWTFAVIDLLGLVYIAVFIKETKGISLNKVESDS